MLSHLCCGSAPVSRLIPKGFVAFSLWDLDPEDLPLQSDLLEDPINVTSYARVCPNPRLFSQEAS